jgi:hypothetical protein
MHGASDLWGERLFSGLEIRNHPAQGPLYNSKLFSMKNNLGTVLFQFVGAFEK